MGRAYEQVSSSVRVLRDALVLTVLSGTARGTKKRGSRAVLPLVAQSLEGFSWLCSRLRDPSDAARKEVCQACEIAKLFSAKS